MTAPDSWTWLALAVCTSLLHCSSGAPPKVAADVTDAAPTCHAFQEQPNGTCCPAGHFYDKTTGACQQVGPPECAEVAFTAPETCMPRWCWDWQNEEGKACEAWKEGCETAGRACTDAEIAEGKGCPAGTFPESDKLGDCAPAGYFPGSGVPRGWNGELTTLPPVPPLEESIPLGVPPLVPLPAVDDTFFCREGPGAEAHFCTEAEMQVCHRGSKGELPDPKVCVYVGVPWPSVCPPGFVVDEAVKIAAGQLAPCQPDPADCGQDAWGDVDDGADVVYVSADGGSDSGKGTKDAPVKTIGKALKLVVVDGKVAVAKGVYSESLAVTKPVEIRGRCAAMVSIEGKAGVPVLLVNGKQQDGELVVSGVRFGGKGSGIEAAGGPNLRLERVSVEAVSVLGIYVHGSGTVLHAQSVIVAGTLPRPIEEDFGRGVEIELGAEVKLQDVRLSANRDVGLFVTDAGTTLDATRILVDGTLPQVSDKQGGIGLNVAGGAEVTVQDARLSANRQLGLFVKDAGTALDATRLLVDGTLPQVSDKKGGWGLSAVGGAHVTLQGARLTASRQFGVYIGDAGTTLSATRLAVDGTLSRESDKKFGRGLVVQKSAVVTLQDVRLSANRDIGLTAFGAKTVVDAVRLLVDGTLSQKSDKDSGMGVAVQDGAQVTLQGTRLSANRQAGLHIGGVGTMLDATHLVVDGTLPRESDKQGGMGIDVQYGAHVMLQDARLSANRDMGLFVSDAGTTLSGAGLVVDGTLPQQSDKQMGRGVGVQAGAQVTLQDARLSANQDMGFFVSNGGTVLGAARLLVDETQPQVSDKLSGRGGGAQNGAKLQMQASRLLGNREAGLFASSASVDIAGVAIEGTTPSDYDQTGGSGIWLIQGSTASLVATALRNNHGVALAADKSTVQVQGGVVVSTIFSKYPESDVSGQKTGEIKDFADGILLNASPNSLIDHCLFAGNERAGILVESSPGVKVMRTLVNAGKGLYGLVLQHSQGTLDQFNAIFSATLQNRETDAGLSLPQPAKEAMELPAEESAP